MSLIKNAKPKRTSGSSGYFRLFGNSKLGVLISKVQSTTISNGSELERIIKSKANTFKSHDELNIFLSKPYDGVFLVDKKLINKSMIAYKKQPDFLIFKVEDKVGRCYVVELKDGDNFDTKKSESEKTTLVEFRNHISQKIPFICQVYICSFNQDSVDDIYHGFKGKFDKSEILTGKDFCTLANINYDEIVHEREKDQGENLDYFLDELLKIESIREKLQDKLKNI